MGSDKNTNDRPGTASYEAARMLEHIFTQREQCVPYWIMDQIEHPDVYNYDVIRTFESIVSDIPESELTSMMKTSTEGSQLLAEWIEQRNDDRQELDDHTDIEFLRQQAVSLIRAHLTQAQIDVLGIEEYLE